MADQQRTLHINGRRVSTFSAGDTPLLDVLRNECGLLAARFGCGTENCGACVVLIDGHPSHACTRTIDALENRAITTLESLGAAGALHPLQQAFLDEQAGQCGYCLSGILMSAAALLDANQAPTRTEIQAALAGHLCRCGAHNRILRAIERAAAAMRARSSA